MSSSVTSDLWPGLTPGALRAWLWRNAQKDALMNVVQSSLLLYVHRDRRDYWGREGLGRPPRLSHSSWPLCCPLVQCCFTSTETVRTVRDGEPRTSTSTFTQLLSTGAILVQVQSRFTSTETVRTIRDREPRTATSSFTQLLSSDMNAKITTATHNY